MIRVRTKSQTRMILIKGSGWVPIIQNIIRSLHRHRGAHLLLQTRSPVCLTPDFLTLSEYNNRRFIVIIHDV